MAEAEKELRTMEIKYNQLMKEWMEVTIENERLRNRCSDCDSCAWKEKAIEFSEFVHAMEG